MKEELLQGLENGIQMSSYVLSGWKDGIKLHLIIYLLNQKLLTINYWKPCASTLGIDNSLPTSLSNSVIIIIFQAKVLEWSVRVLPPKFPSGWDNGRILGSRIKHTEKAFRKEEAHWLLWVRNEKGPPQMEGRLCFWVDWKTHFSSFPSFPFSSLPFPYLPPP